MEKDDLYEWEENWHEQYSGNIWVWQSPALTMQVYGISPRFYGSVMCYLTRKEYGPFETWVQACEGIRREAIKLLEDSLNDIDP